MDEDFTKKSTCLLCDAVVDHKSEIQICSTCAIVAMSDEDFQDLNFISLTENIRPILFNDKEKKRICDLYVPAPDIGLIEKKYQKKSKRN